tara:strand:+ start:4095 stop:4298 length:204 start_codon:yes stop_codon:yes gene_type:complete
MEPTLIEVTQLELTEVKRDFCKDIMIGLIGDNVTLRAYIDINREWKLAKRKVKSRFDQLSTWHHKPE